MKAKDRAKTIVLSSLLAPATSPVLHMPMPVHPRTSSGSPAHGALMSPLTFENLSPHLRNDIDKMDVFEKTQLHYELPPEARERFAHLFTDLADPYDRRNPLHSQYVRVAEFPERIYNSLMRYKETAAHLAFLRFRDPEKGRANMNILQHIYEWLFQQHDMVKDIDDAFASMPPLSQPLVVYRGLSGIDLDKNPRIVNNEFLRVYQSTTLNPYIARQFGKSVMEIMVPAGTRVLPIDNVYSSHHFQWGFELPMYEGEVLLNRTGHYQYLGKANTFHQYLFVP